MKSSREQVIRIVKKGRKHHGGHHGGAWKVAFADFMTSMMALFLVLWLITQSSEVRVAIAGYFQDPMGRSNQFGNSLIDGAGESMMPGQSMQSPKSSGDQSRLVQLSQQIQAALAESPELGALQEHVAIEMTPDGLRISLLEDSNDVFFASGGARPMPQAGVLFHAIGTLLGKSQLPVTVEGHTDAHQYAATGGYDNWNLSTDRAEASRRLLMAGGLQARQITGIRGLADTDPRIKENPRAPQNRRVTILIKDAPALPAVATTPPQNTLLIGHGQAPAARP